ncbi:MAG: chemotaxis protein CheW [Kofleriaceae bacterium]
MAVDEEILQEFLVEGKENLDRLERELVAFEHHGASEQSISAIFRTVHTIKGTAGFFGFDHLQSLTHVAENLLSKVREGHLALSKPIVSAMLAVVDSCRLMMDWAEQAGTDGDDDHQALKATLESFTPKEDTRVPPPPPGAVAPPTYEDRDTTVRVDVGLLDKLMDLAGELVLARNQLLNLTVGRDSPLVRAAQRLDLVTAELQDSVMKTRLQPIGGVWNKLPRIVRDLSSELGKHARLELEGTETVLDRSILEAIKDPLTHLVRNAIDHGIETPAQRIAKRKPVEGVVVLRASHEGGHVVIEMLDDGGGIDPIRIRAKAIERGFLTTERAAQLTEHETQMLVFAAGVSTAERVTTVSGRGVGMDVVKTNIERAGGTVEISSQLGLGTKIRIKIPLTLAIIPALIVHAGHERYAVPQSGVLELVRADGTNGRRVELVDGTPVYRWRGSLLPLVYLDEALGGVRGGATIVVVHNDGRPFGLVVDAVIDTEEIVVKPLGKRLRDLTAYSGATILGDGRIALILDLRGIARRANLATTKRAAVPRIAVEPERVDRFLIVQLAGDRRVAVALDHVARLEALPASALERAAGIEVMQYRDRMLPLVRLGDALGSPGAPREVLDVVVYNRGDRDLGLVVDGVVDIVEQHVRVETTAHRHGLFGSAIIDGRITDIVDVAALAADLGIAMAAS